MPTCARFTSGWRRPISRVRLPRPSLRIAYRMDRRRRKKIHINSVVANPESGYCTDKAAPEMHPNYSPAGLSAHHPLTLFIIKNNIDYDNGTLSNGLRNSAKFVVNMLLHEGIRAKLVDAVDGNSIDKIVHDHQPYRVVIEAIWVTPKKMAELQRLWPKVKWTVRIHSETPFLSSEGNASAWILAYQQQGIEVAFNSDDSAKDYGTFGKASYLPNYYPLRKPREAKPSSPILDVGCFGAIRPLKNQLIQAIAAVEYAKHQKKTLRFHMNGTRPEMNGQNNLKNIDAVLGSQLVLHPWLDHEDFLELIAKMDICLNVSLTESFAIVSADATSIGVPLVGSAAIKWLPDHSRARVDSSEDIVRAMERAGRTSVIVNHHGLLNYLRHAVNIWTAWN